MNHDEHVLQTATDRFERRLAEECGKLHAAILTLRAEMIDRNHELLKWGPLFWATGIAAIAALLALFK